MWMICITGTNVWYSSLVEPVEFTVDAPGSIWYLTDSSEELLPANKLISFTQAVEVSDLST